MTTGLKITSDAGIFEFVGIEPVDHILFGSVGSLNEEAYKGMLKEVEEKIHSLFSQKAMTK